MAGITLWDMLSGKYQSRVPGMNGLAPDALPPKWAAWDPCSMYRSRCDFPPLDTRMHPGARRARL